MIGLIFVAKHRQSITFRFGAVFRGKGSRPILAARVQDLLLLSVTGQSARNRCGDRPRHRANDSTTYPTAAEYGAGTNKTEAPLDLDRGCLLIAPVLTFAGYFYFTRKVREAEMRNVRARSGKIPANAISALLHRTVLVLFKRSVSIPITSERFSL
jgi:hypothetical protein